MTTLADYWDQLNRFDWYYEMTDDFSVWRRGTTRWDELRKISQESPEHMVLFNGFYKHMFTGPAWNNEQVPKPSRPQEIA